MYSENLRLIFCLVVGTYLYSRENFMKNAKQVAKRVEGPKEHEKCCWYYLVTVPTVKMISI